MLREDNFLSYELKCQVAIGSENNVLRLEFIQRLQFEALLCFLVRADNIYTLYYELDGWEAVMQCHKQDVHKATSVILCVFLLGILAGTAAAKKEPKSYPEEGKIIGLGPQNTPMLMDPFLGLLARREPAV